MSDQIPEAGEPSRMPAAPESRLSKYEQWLGALFLALASAFLLGAIAAKTQIEVIATRVSVLEASAQERKQERADERTRALENAERLVRIEAKIEATHDRVARVEAEVRGLSK